ncbi:Glutamate--tRNA ligase [Candidatus Bealeia paramacronuclearis]|uniref:Glutamate--tRNA ligase n=1 Tax=Candidatus Bealeia paramacronuclearis TaxID=1921001 RepID=A0ABZ2C081_9PROT|nr:Glutamate--tRNA ligase [Candidatus Bealeia paramacronuclearis]
MTVMARFAPSPTGFLHIGSARTALFNWLFARHHGGKYYLRIEDTDRVRSTQEAIDAIIEGLEWFGLNWDGSTVFQFERAARHAEVAHALLQKGMAYYCYCSPEELEMMKEEARANGLSPRYNGMWRNRDAHEAPQGVKPVIRFKAPQEGETIIQDLVQGEVKIANAQLDDMVILRADGTPTYMLSVVVDDYDMGITHIIRGDDHLTNAFRQYHLYKAMGWHVPAFAHIPLIHGVDGAKLSKRHGALGIEAYRDMGILPETLRNYLLRLGWSHGDEEIIPTDKAIKWFNLEHVGKSPSRFDMAKLLNLNGHYIREADDKRLVDLILPLMHPRLGRDVDTLGQERLLKGMKGLKQRAKTTLELAENGLFYTRHFPLPRDEKAQSLLTENALKYIGEVSRALSAYEGLWTEDSLHEFIKTCADTWGIKLGEVAQPLRAALTGQGISPSIFEIMEVLGREETLLRLRLGS